MIPRPYQLPAIENTLRALRKHGAALDASDPGTGKTLMNLTVCREVGARPGIIAPLAALPGWERHCRILGIRPAFLHTWEKIRTARTEWLARPQGHWRWSIPDDVLLVFDEVHKAKSHDSQNARLHIAASMQDLAMLCLSATVCSDPLGMRALGTMFGWFREADGFWQWAFRNGVRKNFHGKGFGFNPRNKAEGTAILQDIHSRIFPERGTRLRIADIPDFPKTTIIPEAHALPEEQTDTLRRMLDEIVVKNDAEMASEKSTILTQLLRERQYSETAKSDLLAKIVQDELDNGRSVAVFVNFLPTLELLRGIFDCPTVNGGQTPKERAAATTAFQTNKARVIICQVSAGGQSIDLHDTDGRFPRTSIICPTYSVIELRQILGRVQRTGARSPSIQRIIFAKGTVEEEVCDAVADKLDNLDLLNDGEIMNLVFKRR